MRRIILALFFLTGMVLWSLERPRAEDNPLPPIFTAGQSVLRPPYGDRFGYARSCTRIKTVQGTWVQFDHGEWLNLNANTDVWISCKE